MPKLVIETVVATSHPLPAYGGVQIGDAVLDQIAEALRSGRLPMFVQHDLRRPMDAKILDSEVRPTPDGYRDVWIRFEVDADQWEEFDRERIAAGAPGGFSVSCSEPMTVVERLPSASTEVIDLAADASHWSDSDLLAAAEDLRRIGTVSLSRRYEFAHDPATVVVLGLALDLGVGVLAAALYDGLKRFLLPDRPTTFHFHVKRGGDVVEARLETRDEDTLRRAIETFDELVNPGTLLVWDEALENWRPL